MKLSNFSLIKNSLLIKVAQYLFNHDKNLHDIALRQGEITCKVSVYIIMWVIPKTTLHGVIDITSILLLKSTHYADPWHDRWLLYYLALFNFISLF